LLSVLVIEDKGFAIEFKNQQALIKLMESSPETTQVIRVIKKVIFPGCRVTLFEA
jgi:hypothetical protein